MSEANVAYTCVPPFPRPLAMSITYLFAEEMNEIPH